MTRHRYRLFEAVIASDFAIPWAPAALESDPTDVEIRRVPPGAGAIASESGLRFAVPDVASYTIVGGDTIEVAPVPGADDETVRVYLLGSALGVLLHQRRLLVLHANAIGIGDAAVLFIGASGAGKSTLAGWFAAHGFAVLTDDVCAIDSRPDAPARVLPGLPRLRLSPQALAHFGLASDGAVRCPASGKFELGLPRRLEASRPLAACYLLGGEAADGALSIRPLARLDAIEMLVANTYRGVAVKQLGTSADHLKACLQVAAAAPCFEVRHPRGWSRIDGVGEGLDAHARALG